MMQGAKPGIVVVGLGFTGKRIARMLLERGDAVVAAVDLRLSRHPQNQGKSLAVVLRDGGEAYEGIGDAPLVETIEEALALGPVEVAVISTATQLDAVAEVAEPLLRAGVNVLTTAELAFAPHYPGQDDLLVKRLDDAGRQGTATFFASGVQDVLWASIAATLSGGCSRIDRIYCSCCALLDNLGPRCLEAAMVGRDIASFEGVESDNEVMAQALCVLAEMLGLSVVSAATSVAPVVAQQDIALASGRRVATGQAAGALFKSTVRTDEGVILEADFAEKVSEPGDRPSVRWRLEGEPTLEIIVADACGDDTTCAAIVNRIPDVVNAEPGYRSVADMPLVRCRAH